MRVIFGTSSAHFPGDVFNRLCSTGYIVQCIEQRVNLDLPASFRPEHRPWHFGGSRRHYHSSLSATWPCSSQGANGATADGFATRDYDDGRVTFFSINGTSWAAIGAGSSDGAITTYGTQIANWYATHPNAVLVFSFNHEPNNPDEIANNGGTEVAAAANWRAATQRIWDRWVAAGVPVWEGNQRGETTSPGVILCGPILIGGTRSGAGQTPGGVTTWVNDPDSGQQIIGTYNLWTPQSWTWGWNNMQAVGFDGYNQGEQRPFEEVYGAMTTNHGAGSPARPGFYVWHNGRMQEQNDAGRVLLAVTWETGTRYETDGHTFASNTYWAQLGLPGAGTGLAAAAWMTHLADWVAAEDPGQIFAVNWFDSAVGGQAGNGRMFDMTIDTYLQGFLPMIQNPIWYDATIVDPPDPPGNFVGNISPHTRIREAL